MRPLGNTLGTRDHRPARSRNTRCPARPRHRPACPVPNRPAPGRAMAPTAAPAPRLGKPVRTQRARPEPGNAPVTGRRSTAQWLPEPGEGHSVQPRALPTPRRGHCRRLLGHEGSCGPGCARRGGVRAVRGWPAQVALPRPPRGPSREPLGGSPSPAPRPPWATPPAVLRAPKWVPALGTWGV